MLGASQEVAAIDAGCAERSIVSWEKSSWWPKALAEARDRWLQGGDALARRGLLKALSDPGEYASTAKWWADRRIPELKPPKQRQEHTGPKGGPIQIQQPWDLKKLSNDDLATLRAMASKASDSKGD